MCDKCEELDKKIEHYRQLAARVRDPLLTEGVDKLIEEMKLKKRHSTRSNKSKAASVGGLFHLVANSGSAAS
jgi:hypothetical protein